VRGVEPELRRAAPEPNGRLDDLRRQRVFFELLGELLLGRADLAVQEGPEGIRQLGQLGRDGEVHGA
jgi:hypothetical protein